MHGLSANFSGDCVVIGLVVLLSLNALRHFLSLPKSAPLTSLQRKQNRAQYQPKNWGRRHRHCSVVITWVGSFVGDAIFIGITGITRTV